MVIQVLFVIYRHHTLVWVIQAIPEWVIGDIPKSHPSRYCSSLNPHLLSEAVSFHSTRRHCQYMHARRTAEDVEGRLRRQVILHFPLK